MSDKKYEEKEKSGALFIDKNAQIIRKGSVLWKKNSEHNGKNEKRYFSIIESENNLGEKKLELAMSVGLVFVNNNKFSDDSPDISGNVTIDNVSYKFYGRKKETNKDGLPFTTMQLVETESMDEFHKNTNDDDKMPF